MRPCRRILCLFILGALFPLVLIVGQGKAKDCRFNFNAGHPEREVFSFKIREVGRIKVRADWSGSVPGLALILNGPGQDESFQHAEGQSPLIVTQNVTESILERGTAWSVSVVNSSRSGEAAGTLHIEYPKLTPEEEYNARCERLPLLRAALLKIASSPRYTKMVADHLNKAFDEVMPGSQYAANLKKSLVQYIGKPRVLEKAGTLIPGSKDTFENLEAMNFGPQLVVYYINYEKASQKDINTDLWLAPYEDYVVTPLGYIHAFAVSSIPGHEQAVYLQNKAEYIFQKRAFSDLFKIDMGLLDDSARFVEMFMDGDAINGNEEVLFINNEQMEFKLTKGKEISSSFIPGRTQKFITLFIPADYLLELAKEY